MSTRANVVIAYRDCEIDMPAELWLYHHQDGDVRGIGETVVRAVHACGVYLTDGTGLNQLWDEFPPEFENAVDMSPDIEFLYRVTYADNKLTVIVRHGGYVPSDAKQHYSRATDTPDNSVTLYSARFAEDRDKHIASFRFDIREPESYIRTLVANAQPGMRAWRGILR